MSDVHSWRGIEYRRTSPPILIRRNEEFFIQVKAGNQDFEIGVNMLRPLAEAFTRVAEEIERT